MQRAKLIYLNSNFVINSFSLLGLGIAIYLTMYQIHIITDLWDPIFHSGSKFVLHSKFSRWLPFPDSALGVVGYGSDLFFGNFSRVRGFHLAALFRLLFLMNVAAMAIGSVVLILLQVLSIHHYCTLCLASALISIFMPLIAKSDFLSEIGFMRSSQASSRPLWRVLLQTNDVA